jgi:hypothetical protein
MYVRATGEASSPQNRPSSTSKHYFLTFFFFVVCVLFRLTWFRIRIHNAEPPYSEPADRNQSDPKGSGYTTLLKSHEKLKYLRLLKFPLHTFALFRSLEITRIDKLRRYYFGNFSIVLSYPSARYNFLF